VFFFILKKIMKMLQKHSQKGKSKRLPETLEERVHRHLTDINSKISDEDIRDAKTGSAMSEETNAELQPVPRKRNKRKESGSGKQKKETKIDIPEKQTTPWDLLSEGYD